MNLAAGRVAAPKAVAAAGVLLSAPTAKIKMMINHAGLPSEMGIAPVADQSVVKVVAKAAVADRPQGRWAAISASCRKISPSASPRRATSPVKSPFARAIPSGQSKRTSLTRCRRKFAGHWDDI